MITHDTSGEVVRLPITQEEWDELVDLLVSKYQLPDRNHCSAIVGLTIQHLPSHQAYVELDHLGHSVLKNLAYQLARHNGQKVQHEIQIGQLEAVLKKEPNNQQALDELTKAAGEGSEFARAALDRLQEPPKQNVVSLT